MLELFGIVGSWKLLDMSIDERDIVDTLIKCVNAHCEFNYVISKSDGTPDIRIRNEEEFKEYLNDYNRRHIVYPLDDMSCIELKRYILNKRNKTH